MQNRKSTVVAILVFAAFGALLLVGAFAGSRAVVVTTKNMSNSLQSRTDSRAHDGDYSLFAPKVSNNGCNLSVSRSGLQVNVNLTRTTNTDAKMYIVDYGDGALRHENINTRTSTHLYSANRFKTDRTYLVKATIMTAEPVANRPFCTAAVSIPADQQLKQAVFAEDEPYVTNIKKATDDRTILIETRAFLKQFVDLGPASGVSHSTGNFEFDIDIVSKAHASFDFKNPKELDYLREAALNTVGGLARVPVSVVNKTKVTSFWVNHGNNVRGSYTAVEDRIRLSPKAGGFEHNGSTTLHELGHAFDEKVLPASRMPQFTALNHPDFRYGAPVPEQPKIKIPLPNGQTQQDLIYGVTWSYGATLPREDFAEIFRVVFFDDPVARMSARFSRDSYIKNKVDWMRRQIDEYVSSFSFNDAFRKKLYAVKLYNTGVPFTNYGKAKAVLRMGNYFHITKDNVLDPNDEVVVFGQPNDEFFYGDWNGNNIDTPGYKRGNMYHLTNNPNSRAPEISFKFGTNHPREYVTFGDWDGNGTETVMVYNYDNQKISFRNDHSGGFSQQKFDFPYGPVEPTTFGLGSGDFNADGFDGIYLIGSQPFYTRQPKVKQRATQSSPIIEPRLSSGREKFSVFGKLKQNSNEDLINYLGVGFSEPFTWDERPVAIDGSPREVEANYGYHRSFISGVAVEAASFRPEELMVGGLDYDDIYWARTN